MITLILKVQDEAHLADALEAYKAMKFFPAQSRISVGIGDRTYTVELNKANVTVTEHERE